MDGRLTIHIGLVSNNLFEIKNILRCLITVERHLSGLFTYLDTRLGTNPHISTESDSLIRKFSYTDSQTGNGGVCISEAPL